MKTQNVLSVIYSLLAVIIWTGAAAGQVVRVAPIVKQTATPGGSERFAGASPPASDALVADGSTFYIEVWATNSGLPQDGLACVHVDVSYSRTDVIDALPPAQNSPLFTINAVAPVFNDAAGFVDNVGGCQPAPAIDFLGVGEWVLVERLTMSAVGTGGPVTVSLADANSIFAGTSIIGQLNSVDPVDIEFQFRTFHVGTCLVDGDCDDGVPCTIDTCVSLVCNNTPDDAFCDDGQFCNGAEVCDVLLNCQAGTPPDCTVNGSDGVGCTDDVCDPAAAGGAGACVNNVNNANCDDGQFCNGTETCDPTLDCQAGAPPNCAVLDNDGVACTDDVCDPAANAGAGACVNNVNSTNCDDGQFCNGSETCHPTLDCQPGTPPDCAVVGNDGVGCTDDVCDPAAAGGAGACVSNVNNANCDDGQFCNGAETCDPVLDCQAGTPANCAVLNNDGVACTDDVCDPAANAGAGGCVNNVNNANCDDGQFCNGPETCDALLGCQGGTPPDCTVLLNDNVACTDDVCDPAANAGVGACVNNINDANCDDGQFCNGAETCDPLLDCQAATPPDCAVLLNDNVACTDDVCDPAANGGVGACVNNVNDANCDDGQFCNGAETCDALLGCQTGTAPACDDGVACTTNSCDPAANAGTGGCVNAPDNAFCANGLFCDGVEICDPVLNCVAGANPCDDGIACTVDSCYEISDSCSNFIDNGLCDDGLFCNGQETCNGILGCLPGADPCTSPSLPECDEATDTCVACLLDADCADGVFCNGAELCVSGACQAGSNPCDDGINCTSDSCAEATDTCGHVPNDALCNDGRFCNGVETCDVLSDCQPGTAPTCDDGVGCTIDFCSFISNMCVMILDHASCNDGVVCTDNICDPVNDCQFIPNNANCDDGVTCTVNTCDPVLDCRFSPNDANCDDGQFCNGAETCDPVFNCLAGTPPNCAVLDDDGVACTDDVCDPAANAGAGGCVNVASDANCDDGVACTDNTCDPVLNCVFTANDANCDDGVGCTDDTCDGVLGCQFVPNDANCNDGVGCTNGTCDVSLDCQFTPSNINCDDGLFCNGPETCDLLLDCRPGTAPCDDGVGCTADNCDEIGDICLGNVPSDAFCDDGLFCNGAETCDPVLDCRLGVAPCTDPLAPICDEASDTCFECVGDGDCDDGLFCTGVETCVGNLCQPGSFPCDDGVSCTTNVCDEGTDQCVHNPDSAVCDDGVFCNGAETCDPLLDCQAGTDPCDDGVACTVDSCDELLDSCAHVPNDALCQDPLFCNGVEQCDLILGCQFGPPVNCDDGVACTVDSCNELFNNCLNNPTNANCSDGLFCNGVETCDPVAGCQPGSNPCTNPALPECDEVANVCVECLIDGDCDDGLFCNGDETCANNQCQPGSFPCDDGVACTNDTCNESGDSCSHSPVDALCSDNVFCNGAETCNAVLGCQPATFPCTSPSAPNCNETTDSCFACTTNGQCDDAQFCTGVETCNTGNGQCLPGSDPCFDGVACTVDVCDENIDSCLNFADDSFCDDGIFCNGAEYCNAAAGCLNAGDPCDDGNDCSVDTCNETLNTCQNQEFPYGDVDYSGFVGLPDLFCVLDGFQGTFTRCTFVHDDLDPCGGNGVINLFDLFAVLDAFGGIDKCCHNGIGACCSAADACFAVELISECTSAGGTFKGFGTECFTDSDSDRILDIHETGTGVLNLPCSTGTNVNVRDTDGDGISDGDEVYATDDGLNLPALGANPFRKDLFLELDWTKFNSVELKPTAAAVNAVVQAFAVAPVTNVDGSTGITLHVDYGQGGAFTGGKLIPGTWLYVNFDGGFNALKSANLAANRQGYFYYGIFTYRYNSDSNISSGVAELAGDDFMVTLQDSFSDSKMSRTFMRMLGHNLGLRVGGADDIDLKPNYNSIVNTRFHFSGVDTNCDAVGDGVLDYSRGTRITLNESSLNEFAGVCGSVPINWDGFSLNAGVARNINCLAGSSSSCGSPSSACFDSTCGVLVDQNDWSVIGFNTRSASDPATEVIFGPNTPP